MNREERRWLIIVTDSAGEAYQINDSYLVGTFAGLAREVQSAVEQWEKDTGLVAEGIELESHGKVEK